MGRVVGIDLGTTNSAVAVIECGEPTIIPLSDGARLCPSVVGFNKAGERLVGTLAKRQIVTHPERTIASIKRHMGTPFNVTIDGVTYTPPQVSAMILQRLREDAEQYLGEPVTQAVITVPAYFNDAQRQATKDAGAIAGLEVLRIINEPTAAALAYGVHRDDLHTVLVWDLGGGTFDVSVLELDAGLFEVRATSGDTALGGDDWDAAVVEWLCRGFQEEHGIDLRKDRTALQRLREAAEKAKIELSSVTSTTISLPFITAGQDGPLHLEVDLTRAQLEALTTDLLDRMKGPTQQALQDAGLTPEQIDRILLVGGMTRSPAVQALVRSIFGKEPFKGINPDEVVALGAAIQAGVQAGELDDIVLLDVTPLSLGLETLGGIMTTLIPRNTMIPTSCTRTFTTASDNQRTVDIKVYQGERELVAENQLLGGFQLTGLEPAPRGVPKIDVTFDIDVNGIVHVSARDRATGKEQQVTLSASGGLSPEDIQRMTAEAEAYRAEDQQRREAVEQRNRAEALADRAERVLRLLPDEGGLLGDALRDALLDLREAMLAGDREGVLQYMETVANLARQLEHASAQVEETGPASTRRRRRKGGR